MIKNLEIQQERSRHQYFASQLCEFIRNKGLEISPVAVANAINQHYKDESIKPHTVRKWILGQAMPKGETLLKISNWLRVDPIELIALNESQRNITNRVSFEFDFTDQEVIAKYLSMTIKQKLIVRLLIDEISN